MSIVHALPVVLGQELLLQTPPLLPCPLAHLQAVINEELVD